MRVALTVVITLLLTLAGSGTCCASTIYAVSTGSPGGLYTINPVTGVATLFSNIGGMTGNSDIDFLNGSLYATNIFSGSYYSFGSLDKTQSPIPFTSLNNQGGLSWTGLAAVPQDNKFYAVNEWNQLMSISGTGSASVAAYGMPSLVDMAYDANHDILYGVSYTNLYIINRITGVASASWSLGSAGSSGSLGIGYDNATNTLFLNNGDQKQLYTINTSNGTVTSIGSNNVGVTLDGIAVLADAVTVPEPTTMAMLGGGLILIARLWKTRRDIRTRSRV